MPPAAVRARRTFHDVCKLGFLHQLGQQRGGHPIADDDLETAVVFWSAAV